MKKYFELSLIIFINLIVVYAVFNKYECGRKIKTFMHSVQNRSSERVFEHENLNLLVATIGEEQEKSFDQIFVSKKVEKFMLINPSSKNVVMTDRSVVSNNTIDSSTLKKAKPRIVTAKSAQSYINKNKYFVCSGGSERITLYAGLTASQMLRAINNNSRLSGEVTFDIKEGDLLPGTYRFAKGTSRDSLIATSKRARNEVLDKIWENNKNPQIKTKEDLLILASIIARETNIDDEKVDISAVFSSRLRQGIKLQACPTVIYAITEGKKSSLGRNLYYSDLEVDSPYNTYKHHGLPPTPICSPSTDVIWAAANPSDVDYLFFVASGVGGHLFARTYAEHNKNIAVYKQNLRRN